MERFILSLLTSVVLYNYLCLSFYAFSLLRITFSSNSLQSEDGVSTTKHACEGIFIYLKEKCVYARDFNLIFNVISNLIDCHRSSCFDGIKLRYLRGVLCSSADRKTRCCFRSIVSTEKVIPGAASLVLSPQTLSPNTFVRMH